MTLQELERLFEIKQCRELAWQGKCHDCGKSVEVVCRVADDGELSVKGGAIYDTSDGTFLKCDDCFKENDALTNFHRVEVYSRIVGYLRPIQQWNPGKKAEFDERKVFLKEAI